MLSVNNIRHPKEETYYGIMLFVSIVVYIILALPILSLVFGSILPFGYLIRVIGLMFSGVIILILQIALIIAIFMWWSSIRFKAHIFGHSVNVNANQYPEIYKIAQNQAQQLGIMLPRIFIINDRETNAFATKVFRGKYILLNSGIVDALLSTDRTKELESIIGHELGHHAAGHLSTFKRILLFPGKLIPFVGSAYSRACELTCDRIGFMLCGDCEASQRGLFALALGSSRLLKDGNMNAFVAQENEIPDIAAFFNKLYASHPRTTVRIREIARYSKTGRHSQFEHSGNLNSIPHQQPIVNEISNDDLFS
ncbi:MAG: M48 family metallopeptidase [Flavobacteriia bacterium]|nr:M48 family metallopeptidase [Flavobacteriia bacterium]